MQDDHDGALSWIAACRWAGHCVRRCACPGRTCLLLLQWRSQQHARHDITVVDNMRNTVGTMLLPAVYARSPTLFSFGAVTVIFIMVDAASPACLHVLFI